MKNLIDTLTRLAIEITGNPYIRFIIKRNEEQLRLKAYKKLTIELYLHIPKKNIKCFTVNETVNTANLDKNDFITAIESEFYYRLFKWFNEGEFKNILNGIPME